MISIEVDVKINDQPIKVAGKLNELVAWYITQKLVSDMPVANFATAGTPIEHVEVKAKNMSKSHRAPRPKMTPEEITSIVSRAYQLKHLTQTKAIDILVNETKRSAGTIWKILKSNAPDLHFQLAS